MIIAVNTRLLLPGKIEGIGRFTFETLSILTRQHPEHQFIFVFDRKYADEFIFSSNITPVVAFPPARHPLLWYWFFEFGIPPVLKKYKADLFLSPDGWLSLRTGVPSIPVIHDLNFIHYPQFIPFHVRQYYYYFFPRFVKKASGIVTVSEYSRQDISKTYGCETTKIDVVYNGTSGFEPLTEEEKGRVKEKYTGGSPYFISVGLIHPRKNITGLLLAYERFRKECLCNVKLIIAGARKWWTDDMENALKISKYRNDIIFTGRVEDLELKKLVASALGLVYISWFEGFGIPVLEAMSCRIPVICSSTTSLPEVGGNAVLYADPSDTESVKSAMIKLYKEPALRQDLIKKAEQRLEIFSWQKTASLLWESLEKVSYQL
jgi:glycosyltransferase involved in cell wall biosynthesis